MTTSSRVKAVRKALALSQPELAILIGVHPLTVSKWERGLLAPSKYQQALLRRLRSGCRKAKSVVPVAEWIESTGPIQTLAYLLSHAYEYDGSVK